MYDMIGLKVPTTPAEAEEMLRYFAKNFNGGFHPDDDGHSIVGPNGAPAFSYINAQIYNAINEAIWWQLGEARIYEVLSAIQEERD